MKNLSDLLAGEHGDVDVIMTEEYRLKLARMRAFLMDEEERYQEIDPYDIAHLSSESIGEMRRISFGEEGADSLPDDILEAIEALNSDESCQQPKAPANANRRPHVSWRTGVGMVACLLIAIVVSGVWPGGSSGVGETTALPIDKRDITLGGLENGSGGLEGKVVHEPINYAQLEAPRTATFPGAVASETGGLPVGDLETRQGDIERLAATSANLAFAQQRLAFPGRDRGTWVSTAGDTRVRSLLATISANYDSQDMAKLLQDQFGTDVIVNKTRSPSGMSIVVKDGEVEVHFFRIIVTDETPNPASAADSVSLSPNVFAVLQAALAEGTSVDPTRMRVNDEIVGMVARGEAGYVAPEITFARGDSAFRYSECIEATGEVQLASLANRCIVEHAAARDVIYVNGLSAN